MKKSTKIGLGIAGAFAILFYLVKTGKLTLPALGAPSSLTTVNPNWPQDSSGNNLTPGTIVGVSAQYPQGGVVNMYGYVV